MSWVITKYIITAAVIVLVSELAKLNDKAGALVASLPLITLLTLIWLYVEKQPELKLANHAWYTFWYVIPTLPMFLVFPWLLPKLGFWLTLVICILMTLFCFISFAWLVKHWGIELF